jgi:hypothetical protein
VVKIGKSSRGVMTRLGTSKNKTIDVGNRKSGSRWSLRLPYSYIHNNIMNYIAARHAEAGVPSAAVGVSADPGIGTLPPGESGNRPVNTSTPSLVTNRVCSKYALANDSRKSRKSTYRTAQTFAHLAWHLSSCPATSQPCESRG